MVSAQLIEALVKCLATFPTFWEGKDAILEMKRVSSRYWRQMEWIGFYFQYLCENRLGAVLNMPGPRYGSVQFDGEAEVPWDFKVHADFDAKGKVASTVILNDQLALEIAIRQSGGLGLILARGEARFEDSRRQFRAWHQRLKGNLSKYEHDRRERGASSRLRKTHFQVREIWLYELNAEVLANLSPFQKGMRNADGSLRATKLNLQLGQLEPRAKISF